MEIILENYVIIIVVGLFFVFALIGYLVDNLKNSKKDDNEELTTINMNNIITNSTVKEEPVNLNTADDLLNNYDESSIDKEVMK